MKRYELVIFDLDGTLADTSKGIYNCHRYTTVKMGLDEPSETELEGIIGGPLYEIYKNQFNLNEQQARKAVEIYRTQYSKQGIFEVEIYEGIPELLKMLKEKKVRLAVATLKKEEFAKIILNNLGIAQYFDVIHGVDEADSLSKEDLIKLCIKESNVRSCNSVLIGDSIYDGIGASSCCIDFVGVTYGFGFGKKVNLYDNFALIMCNSPQELFKYFIKLL